MKPYTKKQIAAMRSAIMGAWLSLRDQRMPAGVFSRVLSEKRLDVVLDGIRERISWHEEHANKCRGDARHFREHPSVYGESTAGVISSSEASAARYDKVAAWFRTLEERIQRDGLPNEAVDFDPTSVVGQAPPPGWPGWI